MRWPWKRQRDAKKQDRAAEARLVNAKKLAGEARVVTARLRSEIEKNGFTELFQQAIGGR